MSDHGFWVHYELHDDEYFEHIVPRYIEQLFELYEDEQDDMHYEHTLIIHHQRDVVVEQLQDERTLIYLKII